MSQPHARGSVVVLLAADGPHELLSRSLQALRSRVPEGTAVLSVEGTTVEVNRACEQAAPADVIVLEEPVLVSEGWLDRLRDAAWSDTNTATASALADLGTELAAATSESHRHPLRPRLHRAVGPCVYVRREALELVGPLEAELDLRSALEIDFTQRCLFAGLAHVAADDVLVTRLTTQRRPSTEELPPVLRERYPHLVETPLAESDVLAHALRLARGEQALLWVTVDARALDGSLTGTQVHILELIRALARTGLLRLRLLIWSERIDPDTLALLGSLPETELLAVEEVDDSTPRSAVFHRPQQAFSAEDVALALALGERLVLSQLDLIAYRNPGYFATAEEWADYRRASRRGLAAAERVVVFSEHTADELVADTLVARERVRIVPPGLDHGTPAEPRRPSGLGDGEEGVTGDDFLLCLGTDFRHKNRLFALRLLGALREDHGWRGRLVLAGRHIPHGSSRELEREFLARNPELAELVVELNAISEPEKAWLLAHTRAVVYPSTYEGFGLVPFESALSGVPCVFAPQSSLAEVAPAGTASILPWDASASAAAVHELLIDERARRRHVQTLAGAARELTWAKAAASMVGIYRQAALAPVRAAATASRDALARERALTARHEAAVQTLIDERELVLRDYNELIAELGPGRGLVGARGSLPQDVQHMLLALSARPALSRPVYGAIGLLFAAARAVVRGLGRLRTVRC